jgi:transposase
MQMKPQAKRYDREFKLEAVRLLEESERPLWKIAEELGVSANTLSAWKKAIRESRGLAFPEGGADGGPAPDPRVETGA